MMDEYTFDWEKHMGDLVTNVELLSCGHCGNNSYGKIVASYDNIRAFEYAGNQYEAGLIWELVLCPNCEEINLRVIDFHTGAEPEIGRKAAKILYPPTIESPIGIPAPIDKAYHAALKARHVDANIFTVLLGKTIEAVCQDRKASGKTLYDQLNDLAKKAEIPSHLAEMAHSVRWFRNIGAHFGGGDLTPDEASLIHDLCRAILEYVYTAPALIEKARLSREKIRKNNQDSEND
jgi:hypothetical protein